MIPECFLRYRPELEKSQVRKPPALQNKLVLEPIQSPKQEDTMLGRLRHVVEHGLITNFDWSAHREAEFFFIAEIHEIKVRPGVTENEVLDCIRAVLGSDLVFSHRKLFIGLRAAEKKGLIEIRNLGVRAISLDSFFFNQSSVVDLKLMIQDRKNEPFLSVR